MSLIIENKEALDSLANSIIKANLNVNDTIATKGRLAEIVQNVIPEKAKFASGVFTPTEDLYNDNAVFINYALGVDESGNTIIPDLIFFYQPNALKETELIRSAIFCALSPNIRYNDGFPATRFILVRLATLSTSSRYVSGYFNGLKVIDSEQSIVTPSRFKLAGLDTYPYLADKPIVWLQIKF